MSSPYLKRVYLLLPKRNDRAGQKRRKCLRFAIQPNFKILMILQKNFCGWQFWNIFYK